MSDPIIVADSQYRFSDPIRFYKSNDPYFWAVDNIPLAQIHENTLWLKDQLSARLQVGEIDRSSFAELKPYVVGNDRTVRVKAGRFTARINDVYRKEPLQFLTPTLNDDINGMYKFDAHLINSGNEKSAFLRNTVEKIKNTLANQALGLNGLVERALAFPFSHINPDFTAATYDNNNRKAVTFPISEVLLWAKKTGQATYPLVAFDFLSPESSFTQLVEMENAFIKQWRGAVRTAIVDVPEELTIELPAYDDNDFFYIDENGARQLIPSQVRIDLVFIYSKPIDVSSVSLQGFGETPLTIDAPILGVVKGAGLGISLKSLNSVRDFEVVPAGDGNGKIYMLPHVADQTNANMGFRALNIRGSFPSPDDLMNLAPLLSEYTSSSLDSVGLAGQSILPVAYVAMTRNNIVASGSVVDIRPFFRTTELAYNERAGIAASIPQISFANPVVSRSRMNWELVRLNRQLTGQINEIRNNAGQNAVPRVVGAGYVFGGVNFGVEGALIDFYAQLLNKGKTGADLEFLKAHIKQNFGLPLGMNIPNVPDWDLANWALVQNLPDRGTYPNDWINTTVLDGNQQVAFASYDSYLLNHRIVTMGTDNVNGVRGIANIQFCKKKILIDRQSVPWMTDYTVNLNYWNCIPMSTRTISFQSDGAAGAAGIWISKAYDSFTIYCAWVGADHLPNKVHGTEAFRVHEAVPAPHNTSKFSVGPDQRVNQRDGGYFSAFAVITEEIMKRPFVANNSNVVNYDGEPGIGICTYPTISFNIVGIPGNFTGYANNLNATDPVLRLA